MLRFVDTIAKLFWHLRPARDEKKEEKKFRRELQHYLLEIYWKVDFKMYKPIVSIESALMTGVNDLLIVNLEQVSDLNNYKIICGVTRGFLINSHVTKNKYYTYCASFCTTKIFVP